MKTPKTIIIAALTMSICTTAFADESSTANLPLEQDQVEQGSQQMPTLENTPTAREIMGGKILNKEDGSEIYIECVRTDATGTCEAVHYVLQRGFATTTLTSDIEMKDVVVRLDAIKREIAESAAKYAESRHSKLAHPQLYPVTKQVNLTSDDAVGTEFLLLGLPYIIDTAILPFQLLWVPVGDILPTIHNLFIDSKYRRRAQRIVKAFASTTQEGNRVIKLKCADFETLVSILSGKGFI